MQRIALWMRLALGLAAVVLFASAGRAEVKKLVIGKGGIPWGDLAEEIAALEDTTTPGSLQPREFHPWENVLLGPRGDKGQYTNLLGFPWSVEKTGKGTPGFQLGLTPRIWSGTRSPGYVQMIDGDPDVALRSFSVQWSFDLGFPLPITRIVFYPPAQGLDALGEAYVNLFPKGYEITGTLEPANFLLLTEETAFNPLDIPLAKVFANETRVTEVDFSPTMMRILRMNFGLRPGEATNLSEIEVYAEGFPARTWYISKIIDMEEPVNFGRISWGLSPFRRQGTEVIPDSTAPVRLSLETRTGKDETPLVYHVITEIGKEREVSPTDYNRALEPSLIIGSRPGDRGSVVDDVEQWSFWSSIYRHSGQPVESPDGRQFLKLQFTLESDDIFAFGRLDSIAIEYSPLLVEQVVGEVALRDQPQPPRGIANVTAGKDTVFSFDLRASFASAAQVGFDAVHLLTPSSAEFIGLEMGDPLVPVEPDSVHLGARELTVYFPSHHVGPENNQPVRILFRGAVLSFNSYFTGDVFATTGEVLPQSIDPGDANPAVSTDDVQVFSEIQKLEVLSPLQLSPPVVTPNGDGINDQTTISFVLLGVEAAKVEVGIYDLEGRAVRTLVTERWSQEIYEVDWDGSLDGGSRAWPGIYICKVKVETDAGIFEKMRSVAVAY
jgi:hypothetical protein